METSQTTSSRWVSTKSARRSPLVARAAFVGNRSIPRCDRSTQRSHTWSTRWALDLPGLKISGSSWILRWSWPFGTRSRLTRSGFFDSLRLKKQAEKNVESGRTLLERWWSEKYKLPANHKLFLGRTEASLTVEWFEDLFAQRAEVEQALKSAPATERGGLLERLAALNSFLVEKTPDAVDVPFVTGDPLVDKWEQELAAGLEPDLTEGRAK